MFCKRCGYRLEYGENFCVRCGTPVGNYNNPMPPVVPPMYQGPIYVPVPQKEVCGTAIASMILGITSIFLFGPFTSIPAIVLGATSMKKIDRENFDGRAYAITGLVSGILVTLFWTIIFLMFFFMAIIFAEV